MRSALSERLHHRTSISAISAYAAIPVAVATAVVGHLARRHAHHELGLGLQHGYPFENGRLAGVDDRHGESVGDTGRFSERLLAHTRPRLIFRYEADACAAAPCARSFPAARSNEISPSFAMRLRGSINAVWPHPLAKHP
jgi:hypothetical protein